MVDKKQLARDYAREWRKTHKEQMYAAHKKWCLKNPEKVKEYALKSKNKHREKIREAERMRYRSNPEPYLLRSKLRYIADPKRWTERTSAWKKKNPKKEASYRRKTRYKRYHTDIGFKIVRCLKNRLRHALRGKSRSSKAQELVGCPIEDFKIYIESKFEPGMSWKNWGKGKGKWNLDHIIPCAIFDFKKPEHQKRCFHFSNYQPLWENENLSKRDKIITNQFNLI